MGAEWPRTRFSMPPRMDAEFKALVKTDGRSPGEILRSLIEPWIEGRRMQAAVLKSVTTSTETIPSTNVVLQKNGPSNGPSTAPSKDTRPARR